VGVPGTRYHLTRHKTRDLPAQLTGVDFSVGAISQAQGKIAQALEPALQPLCVHVNQAPLQHLDETRYPREGAGNWAWAVVIAQGRGVRTHAQARACQRQGRAFTRAREGLALTWRARRYARRPAVGAVFVDLRALARLAG
jgi:hypothetical protein